MLYEFSNAYIAAYAMMSRYCIFSKWNTFVTDSIECSDYSGNNRYRVCNETGRLRAMTIGSDVVYYSTAVPNR